MTLRDPPPNPNTVSPKYNPNAKYAYHSDSPRPDTNDCWSLKNKIQDLIDNKTIEFDPPPTPNIITAPMPNHGKGVNAIEDIAFVSSVNDLTTLLKFVTNNLLKVVVFHGCLQYFCCCVVQINGCEWLKRGVQHLMDNHEILFKRTPSVKSFTEVVPQEVEDISITTISKKPLRITSKGPIRIPVEPRIAPLIITTPGPIPYSSYKAVP